MSSGRSGGHLWGPNGIHKNRELCVYRFGGLEDVWSSPERSSERSSESMEGHLRGLQRHREGLEDIRGVQTVYTKIMNYVYTVLEISGMPGTYMRGHLRAWKVT